jgi:glycosyltransferase involved in cell wall biosynthesis
MPLTVLQVAYPFAPVGIDCVGGAEQILAACDEAVARAGHRSIVVACEGSRGCGELITVPKVSRADDAPARAAAHINHRTTIEEAIAAFDIDVIHYHGIDFDAYAPGEAVTLVTLHLDPASYDARALARDRPNSFFNCVSRTQHARCPKLPNLLPPVENGVDVERLRLNPQAQRKHVVLLARICPEKGIHLAIEAAKRADVDLMIAGEIFPYADHERYFAEQVRPHLDSRRIFVGAAGLDAKRKLLQSARCLLVPSLSEETSSLVAMEALACGTPVIAFRRGALSEIVENGVTGVVVDNIEEMAVAICNLDSIEAADCVSAARRRFSAARMTRDYLGLYEKLRAGTQLRRHAERVAS